MNMTQHAINFIEHADEVATGQRFEFGKNWSRFLNKLTEERVIEAENSLREKLGVNDLSGKTFLDIGSGSGLFSLAARRLGARVYSFDYDPKSVACAVELKRRYFQDDPRWTIDEGSALDVDYLRGLGQFDIVYSWGVLHHTGAMWVALNNVRPLVAEDGQLFIAIYNDQQWLSRYWTVVKKLYNKNPILRLLALAVHAPYLFGGRLIVRALSRRLQLDRGMSYWYDTLDWLGGYPFEVAKPEEVFALYAAQGFVLTQLKTCSGRLGCNEFVFRKTLGAMPKAASLMYSEQLATGPKESLRKTR
jgi:2-polyprenyl-3-methyl-5-hydroxy-6-metoxy-1,4-benzoquinol methylase